jgi:hypothetical protein
VVKLNLDSVGLTQDLGTNFLGEFVYGKPLGLLAHSDWFNTMVPNRLMSRQVPKCRRKSFNRIKVGRSNNELVTRKIEPR